MSVHLQNVIDHCGHRITHAAEMLDAGVQKCRGLIFADRRQNDQAGMQVLGGHECPEIAGVLGNDDEVLHEAACQDEVIGLAAAAEIKRMDRDMFA